MTKKRPWLAVTVAGAALALLVDRHVKPWMYCWGATAEEAADALPGDELVRSGVPRTTRAVSIDAPVEHVWPWLAQLGEDRGGFYSYSLLERAAGADIHNASVIHPEWQDVHVGDVVWLAHRFGERACQVVAEVVEKSHLVLVSRADFERIRRGEPASGSWAFHLHPMNDGTRLLIRGSGGAVGHVTFDVPHFIMERKMLSGIRHRAESVR